MFFRTSEDLKFSNTMPANLTKQLMSRFPIDTSRPYFEVFPFSNEARYSYCLHELRYRYTPQPSHEIRVALLFGESRFLSLLPELSLHADVIIFADIEPKQHNHIKHLLSCMQKSTTIKEYINNYAINNPLENIEIDSTLSKSAIWPWYEDENLSGTPYTTEILTNLLHISGKQFSDFFLNSEERYNQCKNAANKLSFAHIQLDLMNHIQCQELAQLLSNYHAKITFCNLSNIHDYDNSMERIKVSVPLLLTNSPDCLIMYATNSYQANISNLLNDYYEQADTWLKTHRDASRMKIKQPLMYRRSCFFDQPVINPFVYNMIIPDDTTINILQQSMSLNITH